MTGFYIKTNAKYNSGKFFGEKGYLLKCKGMFLFMTVQLL
jgi:hypothetical protein